MNMLTWVTMDASMLELERAQNFQARTALGLWVIVPGRGRAFEKSLHIFNEPRSFVVTKLGMV